MERFVSLNTLEDYVPSMSDTSQPSRNQNIKVLTVRSLLYGIFQRIFMVIRQPFILSLNPSIAVMEFLEGLGGFQGLIPAFIQPFFGWISDRMQRKPFIVLGSILMELSLILFFYLWVNIELLVNRSSGDFNSDFTPYYAHH